MATKKLPNASIRNLTISHTIDLTHYANGVVGEMLKLLKGVDADLSQKLFSALNQMSPSSFTVQRLDQLLANVNSVSTQIYAQAQAQLSSEMRGLAEYETQFQRSLLDKHTPEGVEVKTPGVDQVYAAAAAKPFQGKLMSEWFSTLSSSRAERMRKTVAMGFVEGKTVQEMVREVVGTRAQGYKDGILQVDRREAEAIVRTAVSHTAAVAREELYRDNADLIEAEQWLSTLDSRTTPLCQVRDGRLYTPRDHEPIGHKVPWLAGPGAIHWNCRSVSIPVLAKDLTRTAAQRASIGGPVAGGTTYKEWLASQPASRQDQVLGATRGKMLREGSATFDKFFNNEGRRLTLAELRASDFRAMTESQKQLLAGSSKSAQQYAALKDAAADELKALGMGSQRVTYLTGDGATFADLGSGWQEVAKFSVRKIGSEGVMSINLDMIASESHLRQIVRHEAQHARFNAAAGAKVDNFMDKNLAALRREDGTTNYSKAHWERYERMAAFDEKFQAGTQRGSELYNARALESIRSGALDPTWNLRSTARTAVNESLSEMHAFNQSLPSTYAKLNDIVETIWKKKSAPKP